MVFGFGFIGDVDSLRTLFAVAAFGGDAERLLLEIERLIDGGERGVVSPVAGSTVVDVDECRLVVRDSDVGDPSVAVAAAAASAISDVNESAEGTIDVDDVAGGTGDVEAPPAVAAPSAPLSGVRELVFSDTTGTERLAERCLRATFRSASATVDGADRCFFSFRSTTVRGET